MVARTMTHQEKRIVQKVLLTLLKHKELFSSGLCGWVNELSSCRLISGEEFDVIRVYIDSNRPSKYSSLGAYLYRKNNFYWPPYRLKPRLRWINKHLDILSS